MTAGPGVASGVALSLTSHASHLDPAAARTSPPDVKSTCHHPVSDVLGADSRQGDGQEPVEAFCRDLPSAVTGPAGTGLARRPSPAAASAAR